MVYGIKCSENNGKGREQKEGSRGSAGCDHGLSTLYCLFGFGVKVSEAEYNSRCSFITASCGGGGGK